MQRLPILQHSDVDVTGSPKRNADKSKVRLAETKMESCVGLVVTQFSSDASSIMLDGANDFLRLNGYREWVRACQPSDRELAEVVAALFETGCHGVILNGSRIATSVLQRLLDRYQHLVILNRCVEGYESRSVCINRDVAGRVAARHLLRLGHKDIAMITESGCVENSLACSRGFIDELAKNQVFVDRALVIESRPVVNSNRSRLFLYSRMPWQLMCWMLAIYAGCGYRMIFQLSVMTTARHLADPPHLN